MKYDDIERVLRAAGPRDKPPADVERSVRGHLREEWLLLVAGYRRRRLRRVGFALAASLVTVALAVWIAAPWTNDAGGTVATLAFATGDVRVSSGWWSGQQPVAAGRPLSAGQELATGADGRVAVSLAGGASLRLDRETRVVLERADRLVIEQGGLYVDAGPVPAMSARLDVVTPTGIVRHVGTQYEVRRLPAGVRLRVREGRVEWSPRAGDAAVGVAGEQLMIGDAGTIERTDVAGHGEDWNWVASTAPAIDIDGQALERFLAWAGRELGCEPEFASSEVAAIAAGIVLHGSIENLSPELAIRAVFATTTLRAVVEYGCIRVLPAD